MAGFIITIFLGLIILAVRLSQMDHLSKSVLSFYLFIWGLAILLSALNLFHINIVSSNTYVLLFIHVVAFVLGFSIQNSKRVEIRTINHASIDYQINRLVNNKLFRVALIVITLYVISLFWVYFRQIMIYNNLADIRSEFYYGDNMYGEHYRIINQWLLKPFSIIVIPLFAYLCYNRRDKYCLLIGLFLLIYNSLSAGRFGYIKIAIGFVFIVFCLLPYLKKKASNWLVVLLVFAAVYLLVMMVTVARLQSFGSFSSMTETGREIVGENAVIAVTQPINSLDYAINAINQNYVDRVGGYQYGGLTLTSLQKIVNPFLRIIDSGFVLSSSKLDFKQEEYIDIGYIRDQNALYTSSLWYYLDLGWIGVILFPFLFGLLIRTTIMRLYKYQSFPSVVMVAYLFQLMIFSLFDYYITGEHDLFFLILLWWLSSVPQVNKQRMATPLVIYLVLAFLYSFTQL